MYHCIAVMYLFLFARVLWYAYGFFLGPIANKNIFKPRSHEVNDLRLGSKYNVIADTICMVSGNLGVLPASLWSRIWWSCKNSAHWQGVNTNCDHMTMGYCMKPGTIDLGVGRGVRSVLTQWNSNPSDCTTAFAEMKLVHVWPITTNKQWS